MDDGKQQRGGRERHSNALQQLLAGGMAGAVSRTAVSPLERAKIIMQVNGRGAGIRAMLAEMWRSEGPMGLFRGNGTNVIRIFPYSAVQFMTFEQLKKLFLRGSPESDLNTQQRLAGGALAGIASVVATYPLDVIRTRLSLNSRPQSIISCAVGMWRREPAVGIYYRGLLPTALGVAPYVALSFAVYGTLRGLVLSEEDVVGRLACGGAAGAVAQTITYPLDVLRRRMQASETGGLANVVRQLHGEHGWRGFYLGILPNYLKVVPSIAISFFVYESAMRHLV